ncbi:GrpB family protein [uncultured Agrobacterium sp.]|uniref:GrpB family protein n=1 Tax=uncultured Agrobacterium sp. TaxID=157277 RepID=UPI0025D07DD8|nr:GrpB family protein [uncultured Agrobacterium sp.]
MGTLVKIVPSDSDWPSVYSDAQHRLEILLKGMFDSIEHVGSTAVHNLSAKPHVDIDVVVKHLDFMQDSRARMEAVGFEPRGSRHGDGVFAFKIGAVTAADPLPGLRVYLCPPDSVTHQNRVRFRDILRQNLALANDYTTLKNDAREEIQT